MDNGPVVAGVDGSASGFEAVEQAAWEARLRSVPLRLLHAYPNPYTLPPAPVGVPMVAYGPAEEELRDVGEQLVTQAADRAHDAAPEIDVVTEVVSGEPLPALVGASESASLVVVGSRGLGGFARLLLGSVAVQLAAHSHCPVWVVRGSSDPAGDIVLGADGSAAARAATEFAFREASLRGARLTAVHVSAGRTEPAREDAEVLLSEAIAGCPEQYPDVEVERRAVRGGAREQLVDASEGAQLLVVGARGLGGFTGLLLGSVSQAVLQHAECPVAVVRGDE